MRCSMPVVRSALCRTCCGRFTLIFKANFYSRSYMGDANFKKIS